ncbi:MAG: fibronectin type III domain-containing protein [candidate division Zixibacteria bacterium]|nr:fibronectin type III domain-containing protein [candidate division Zixibacteria bacterium]
MIGFHKFSVSLKTAILICFSLIPAVDSLGLEPANDGKSEINIPAPTDIVARDFKYDRGEMIEILWRPSVADHGIGSISGYEIFRSEGNSDNFVSVGFVPPETGYFKDNSVEKGKSYRYQVAANVGGIASFSRISDPVYAQIEFINWNLLNLFVIGLLISGFIIYFISHAKRGKKLFIRKIAGLDAIDDAIGRATEMGRPILFVPGINDMDDVQTIAGITLLGRVAKVVADYDIKINMPVARSLVMTTARETIRNAYLVAGRPEAYSENMVNYITDEQFGYVAAVDGIMVREKPATCFYLGAFFAESLILAETGNSIGAIQIAGTAQPAQLPFFVAACDYTLIGEELFAASAYLSNEPKQLGSLKGQDMGKLFAMIVIFVGVIAATISQIGGGSFFVRLNDFMQKIFTVQN